MWLKELKCGFHGHSYKLEKVGILNQYKVKCWRCNKCGKRKIEYLT